VSDGAASVDAATGLQFPEAVEQLRAMGAGDDVDVLDAILKANGGRLDLAVQEIFFWWCGIGLV
jgi:hypothetical protein